MNHKIWTSAGARVLAAMFIVAGAAACDRDVSDTSARAPDATPASPSAVVIGTAPAEPKADTAGGGASPEGANSEVTKAQENTARPLEGDNHSYSTVAPTTPQKASGVNVTGDGSTSEERKPQ